MAAYMQKRRIARREKLKDIIGRSCVLCGSLDDIEFDHIDPATKSFSISQRIDAPWQELLDEAVKCQPLCNQCHIEKTRREHQKRIPWNKNLRGKPEHGSARMYSEFKCKCALCRHAKKLYRNKEIEYHQVIRAM